MDKVAPASRRFQRSNYKGDGGTSQNRKSVAWAQSAVPQPFSLKTTSSYIICTTLIFAMTSFRVISAQPVANFSVERTNYSSNVVTLGGAHVITYATTRIASGQLSLTPETVDDAKYNQGIAYYNRPVRLLDRSTNRSASFSTSFTFDVTIPSKEVQIGGGDGMTFVMSANKSSIGVGGGWFGIFNDESYSTPFKSIVVEFDTFRNVPYPWNDISDNHVSFDIMNITGMAPANASDVSVNLTDALTKYAWVDYSNETQQLEVRVSYNNTKPGKPLSNYGLNLSDFVEEDMWVGFSSSSGGAFSNFYIGNWTFETYGLPEPPIRATGTSSGGKVGIIAGSSLGILAFLIACAVVIAVFVRRRRSGGRDQLGEFGDTEDNTILSEGMPVRFRYKQLSMATKAFSEEMKLGQGGFGSVYRGVLPSSGIAVAVKKIKSDSNQGEKEFMAEVSIISRLRHRNLIQLQGWCKDAAKEKYLLVYELMPNGSLDKVLFEPGNSESTCLSWAQRFNIVKGTAAAVDYLHSGWKQQVLHRDIKSSNIMLCKEWNAKLGDFGLARLVDHQRAATTTMVAGTYGYIAPEAAASGRFTDKTDVFAFGAVVLEIACGRRALSVDFPPEESSLVDWVWRSLSESDLLKTVDKRMTDYDTYWMNVVLIVGLWCSHPNPFSRPSMRHVVQVLAGDAPVPSIPATKPAAVFCVGSPNITIDSLLGGRFMWSSSTSKSTSTIPLGSMSNSDSTGQSSTLKSFGSSMNSSASESLLEVHQ